MASRPASSAGSIARANGSDLKSRRFAFQNNRAVLADLDVVALSDVDARRALSGIEQAEGFAVPAGDRYERRSAHENLGAQARKALQFRLIVNMAVRPDRIAEPPSAGKSGDALEPRLKALKPVGDEFCKRAENGLFLFSLTGNVGGFDAARKCSG